MSTIREAAIPVAAIDCGTNSTRLLIADGEGNALCRELRTTRLGDKVDATGVLNHAAIERTVDTLRQYRSLIDRHGVALQHVTAVATSAARDAANSEQFFTAAEAALGVRPVLLTGQQEGELTFAGATADLHLGSTPTLVIDIGGGSTEFALGVNGVVEAVSVDMGCVRLTEQFLHGDPYGPDELADAFAVVEDHVTDVSSKLAIAATGARLVGVAGTLTSLAGMDLGLTAYDRPAIHHHQLQADAVEEIFRSVSMQTNADRQADPTMPPQRSEVLVAGMIILLGVFRHFQFDHCLVADSDILEGLVLDMLNNHME